MILAFFAALIILLLTLCFALCRHNRYKLSGLKNAVILIPVSGDDNELEERIRALYWEESFSDFSCSKEIVLVVFEHCAAEYTAKRLEQKYKTVHVVNISSLSDYLIRNYTI